MSNLLGTLSLAVRSMMAQKRALTGKVSRSSENPNRTLPPSAGREAGAASTGIDFHQVESIRDALLELRRNQELHQEGALETFLQAAREADSTIRGANGPVLKNALQELFDRLGEWKDSAASLPARQGVLSAGESLSHAFGQVSDALKNQRTNLDQSIRQTVAEINVVTKDISQLNGQIGGWAAKSSVPEELLNRRRESLRRLSGLIDTSVIDAQDGTITITTFNGAALVAGAGNFVLESQFNESRAREQVVSQGNDITSRVLGGRLRGEIQARDELVVPLLVELDGLAFELSTCVNATHELCYDLTGSTGRKFFAQPGTAAGAAGTFAMVLTSPEQLAASIMKSAEDSEGASTLAGLRDRPIVNGQTPLDFCSNLAARRERELAAASSEWEAEKLVLQQLKVQRAKVAGTSFDEEALSLLRFQRGLEAAARVAGVVDELISAPGRTGSR